MNKQGSEKYGTSIMTSEEVVLFAECAVQNGADIPEAFDQIKFVDDCLAMQKLVTVMSRSASVRYTKKGSIRKNVHFQDFISNRLNELLKQ